MNIVWFKCDLRVFDHAPLKTAADQGAFVALYVFEPELWKCPDMSYRHFQLLQNCLLDLEKKIAELGGHLTIMVGDVLEAFAQIMETHPVQAVYAHEETKNAWTYARDRRVRRWLREQQVKLFESPNNGVVRRLADRDLWTKTWYERMSTHVVPSPVQLETVFLGRKMPTDQELGLSNDGIVANTEGSRQEAVGLLSSFLNVRGKNYTYEMSSPVSAYHSCSRLSKYLATGVLSVREVYQAVKRQEEKIKGMDEWACKQWRRSLRSFKSRLAWHCHFIQKLEDEPAIELCNMHPAYDQLRVENNPAFLAAWQKGQTGFVMIDACMRALLAEGWINFRMRAMLMSFASYHLWLDWRVTAPYLGSLFIDYEPGIHYSQCQMQSGTTGMNAIRIYNPIKQAKDQDPKGVFIRKWLPELRDMPDEFIHEPALCPDQLNGYPLPIVDEKIARKFAAEQLYGLRKQQSHRDDVAPIVKKHASRKRRAKPKPKPKSNQGELDI